MTQEQEKRQVPITNLRTGEVRLSEPITIQAVKDITHVDALQVGDPVVTIDTDERNRESEETKKSSEKKIKPDIQSLDQLITSIYGRKGQRIPTISPKVERAIAENFRINEEANARLFEYVVADEFLLVPRHLLLLSREIVGYPALKDALSSFVMNVMLRHPIFSSDAMQAVIRNLPAAPSPADSLKMLSVTEPIRKVSEEKGSNTAYKPAEITMLRRNATHLLATWFFCQRGINLEELAVLLLQTCWGPSSVLLEDDNSKLRELTNIEEPAILGWIGLRWRQQLSEAKQKQDHAERQLIQAREEAENFKNQLVEENAKLLQKSIEFEQMRVQVEQNIQQLRLSHDEERMHLSHEIESLRGRLIHRLTGSIDMLEVGLAALRNSTPRTEVMVQRAEQVVDALRAELQGLQE